MCMLRRIINNKIMQRISHLYGEKKQNWSRIISVMELHDWNCMIIHKIKIENQIKIYKCIAMKTGAHFIVICPHRLNILTRTFNAYYIFI